MGWSFADSQTVTLRDFCIQCVCLPTQRYLSGALTPNNMADTIVSTTAGRNNASEGGSTRLTLASFLAEVRSDEAAELA